MKKQVVLITSLFSIVCTTIYSQTDTTFRTIPAVEIHSNRIQSEKGKTTQNIIIITKEEIQKMPARSIQEVLSFAAGVDVRQRGTTGIQADISIRGGSFEQTLFLINGIKLTDPQTGHHAMNIPVALEAIERIEIIKGPATRMFGQNAFAGAVNIITKTGTIKEVSVGQYAADFGAFGGHLFLAMPIKKNVSQTLSGSFDNSRGHWHNSDYKTITFNHESTIRLKKFHELKTLLAYTSRDFGANGYYSASFPDQWEATKTGVAALAHTYKRNAFSIQTRAYYRINQDEFRLKRYVPSFYTNTHESQVVGLESNATLKTRFGTTGFGLEARNEALNSSNLGVRSRSFYGMYLEQALVLFKLLDTRIGLHASKYNQYDWKFFPGIEMAYQLNSKNRIYSTAGLSYRIPTYTELFYVDPSTASNANLVPEIAKTVDIGWIYTTNKFRIEVNYFNRSTTNLIDYTRDTSSIVPNPNKWTPKNIGHVTFNGAEFTALWKIGAKLGFVRLDNVSLSYNYIDATVYSRNAEESKYALSALKQQLIGGLQLTIADKLVVNSKIRFIERMNLNAYTLLDLKLIYQRDNVLQLFTELSNATNTSYVEAGYAQMPGRWLKVGCTVRLH
ncbi:MAG: TonB-dependent receptor [Fluviicola sp.]|nr:TonB-dependent receptor [Fluviicola sp.]MBP6271413.1 TonB-dependent receptor [Fluviicola sp.]